jgi:hypothetical protein
MLFGTEHVKIFLLKQGHVLQKLNHSMALSWFSLRTSRIWEADVFGLPSQVWEFIELERGEILKR